MTADDPQLRARLAALEAEVKADADAQRARKEAALAKVRQEQARRKAEQEQLRAGQAKAVRRASRRDEGRADRRDDDEVVTGALARAAGDKLVKSARAELSRERKEGEKSWLVSGLLSMFFGPLGWLYAGSFREAVPASIAYLLAGAILTKLPLLLLMPVMMVVMPISGIAGAVYAWQYNRAGHRTRLFGKDDDEEPGKLPPGA